MVTYQTSMTQSISQAAMDAAKAAVQAMTTATGESSPGIRNDQRSMVPNFANHIEAIHI